MADVSAPPEGPPGPPAAASAGKDGGRSRRRRWPFILLAVVVLLGAAGYGLFKLAPSYIARTLARTYFQGLDIDTAGVETISINLLRGEVSFGPVKFGGGEGEAAQVGQIRAKLDVRRLFSRQALVQDAEISGIASTSGRRRTERSVSTMFRSPAFSPSVPAPVSAEQNRPRHRRRRPRNRGRGDWGSIICGCTTVRSCSPRRVAAERPSPSTTSTSRGSSPGRRTNPDASPSTGTSTASTSS